MNGKEIQKRGDTCIHVADSVAQVVKNLPTMWETNPGSIPGLGGFPGERNGNPLWWRIPWTEEPGGL